jgi:hypothetical protein
LPSGTPALTCRLLGEKPRSTADDEAPLQFYLAYRSLCPPAWVSRWNDQRGMLAQMDKGEYKKLTRVAEAGNFPVDLEH